MELNKRALLRGGLGAALLAAAAMPALAKDKEPIRIGVPTALTGPYGALGQQVKQAVQFAVDEANAKGGVDGRKVEVEFLDTQAKPEMSRQQAEKLALSGYNLLMGTIASGEALAIGPMLDRWGALYISTINKADAITGSECEPMMFRVNHPDYSDAATVGAWLDKQPQQKWAVMGSDTAWGRNSGTSFEATAKKLGKQVVVQGYAGLGTNDFAPYIQKISDSGAKGLWVALAGRDGINFAQQAHQFGLLQKLNTAGVSFVTDNNIATLGDITKGIWSIINYSALIDTPENKAFATAWAKKFDGAWPTNFEGETYLGTEVLFQAVAKAGSVKPEAVAKAMRGASFKTVFGDVTMRAGDNQLVLPNYFGRVNDYQGKLRPVITLTIPASVATPGPDKACKF